MLYPKKETKQLDMELFKNPSKEYRAAPFWAWNCELSKEVLEKEIEVMKEMGFGGYYMHTRVGMATKYLSEEFMDLIRTCIEKGKAEDMYAYLYDEDRWPSGTAGGFTTQDNDENLQKILYFTYTPYNDGTLVSEYDIKKSKAPEGKYKLISCYDVELNEESRLVSYKEIGLGEEVAQGHEKWFAYMEYGAYCDTMRKSTVDKFIKLTYEAYKNACKEDFGTNAPTIFTDEPNMRSKKPLERASDKKGAILPYTNDLEDTFKAKYGISLKEHIPELFFERADREPSRVRYLYHDHTTERFAEAFAYNIGKWCGENGIMFTGHMLQEDTLYSQTCSIGEAMRHYKGFQLPGIDMLCHWRYLNTAKQAQSVAHQYGKEGVMSELYGVTNWDFDFHGHKLLGDWQAALGVTHRVPHLYWVSMGGEAKRDYPASIGHQSPWYKEYKHIEDHFARLGTVMTRGKANVKVAVVHPIESYWLNFGPADQTGEYRSAIGDRFNEFTNWMLFGFQDFDFVCESLLPEQYKETESGFAVGEMKYDTVIVPYLETIRSTTLEALKKFRAHGGKVIFMGEVPKFVDAAVSDKAKIFAEECEKISWSQTAVLGALESKRFVDIRKQDGYRAENMIHQLRDDGNVKHLFVSHVHSEDYDTAPVTANTVILKGEWTVSEYDTMKGEKRRLAVKYNGGNTEFTWVCAVNDSLLLELSAGKDTEEGGFVYKYKEYIKAEYPVHKAEYRLEEPNVLLLDRAKYSLNGEAFSEPMDVLKIDEALHFKLTGKPYTRRGRMQPWQVPLDKNPKDVVTLVFDFDSETEYYGARLALEYPEFSTVTFNGEAVPMNINGNYVDDAIVTIPLPKIRKGENTLEIRLRYSNADSVEAYYILGDFGVETHGYYATVTNLPEKIYFESLTDQKMSFYGGNVHYSFKINGGGKKTIEISKYRGAVIKVFVDGEEKGYVDFPPHRLSLGELAEGEHTVELVLYGNRMNTFGQLHKVDEHLEWLGPDSWRTKGRLWTDEYQLTRFGILTAPRILTEE
ncbi:MAG: hypothetical protein IJW76_05620 [Clostridia bacterium]|nr:hypothetical protein [Clostridia bacterium]